MTNPSNKGFTMTEIMVVLVIIALMASFALPNFMKSVQKAYERDAISSLVSIASANSIYKSNALIYWPGPGADATAINTALGLNITSDRLTFTYEAGNSDTYEALATLTEAGGEVFVLRVNQTSLGASNPCCESGTCQIADDCVTVIEPPPGEGGFPGN